MIHESEPSMTNYPGAELLRSFLESKRPLTQAAAAGQLGIVPAALTAYLKGIQRPRSDIRQRIAKWSEGHVPESAWLTTEERAAVDDVDAVVIPEAAANETQDAEHPSDPNKTGTTQA